MATYNTPLITACLENKRELALSILDSPDPKLNYVDSFGKTALIYACEFKLVDVALKIIQLDKRTANFITQSGSTPLIVSINSFSEGISIRLIETGLANLTQVDIAGMSALMYACKLKLTNIALKIIGTDATTANYISPDGSTPLIFAIAMKLDALSIKLIETGMSNPGQVNSRGLTALIGACINSLSNVALKLIETGQSNPGAKADNATALYYACVKHMNDVAIKLIDTGECDPSQLDMNGNTLLMIACSAPMPDVVLKLIETGMSKPGHTNRHGITALMLACEHDQNSKPEINDVIIKLLETGDSKPGLVAGPHNMTALMALFKHDNVDMIFRLIETGESNPGNVDDRGMTALMMACEQYLNDVASALIQTGQSNPGNAEIGTGATALTMACRNNMFDIAMLLVKTGKSNPSSIEFTPADDTYPETVTTALMLACDARQSDLALEIIKTGESRFDYTSNNGLNALAIARQANLTDVVAELSRLYGELNETRYININEIGNDMIESESKKISDYISESPDNICIMAHNNYYLVNKTTISRQLQQADNIKYACVSGGFSEWFWQDDNIYDEPRYFNTASICQLQGLVETIEIDKILAKSNTHQLYYLHKTSVCIYAVMSQAYLDGGSGVGADHCNPGPRFVYDVKKAFTKRGRSKMSDSTPASEETSSLSEEPPAKRAPTIKIQYKGKIYTFVINETDSIGSVKALLLNKLLEDNEITSLNQRVRFIFSGRIFTDDSMLLTSLADPPYGITLQANVIANTGGRSKKRNINIKRSTTRKNK